MPPASSITLDSFVDESLVVCPRCGKCARVAKADAKAKEWFAPPADDYFNLPLWIQAACCGHTLWAYNWRHLAFLEELVRDVHRERSPLANRLPRWLKSAQNREPLLACMEKLRQERAWP